MNILVTGGGGFIGFHCSLSLLEKGIGVTCIDNMNSYYDVKLKKRRIAILSKFPNFEFIKRGLESGIDYNKKFDYLIHLAAQAGVSYSLINPNAYINSNITSHLEVLKFCQKTDTKLIYASSSSVYGNHKNSASVETDQTDNPISIYGTTKKSCEMLSENYFQSYGLEQVGLRFFTVYGEWGRPDMAYWIFLEKMFADNKLELYGKKNLRDLTYIKTVIQAINKIIFKGFEGHEIYNIGNSKPAYVEDIIDIYEKLTNKKALVQNLNQRNFEVIKTSCNTKKFEEKFGELIQVELFFGLEKFYNWYKMYRNSS